MPNTVGAGSGSKYGGAGTIDGCQVLFCGAQALAMADIGNPEWHEKGFDYENQQGIAVGKIVGFLAAVDQRSVLDPQLMYMSCCGIRSITHSLETSNSPMESRSDFCCW